MFHSNSFSLKGKVALITGGSRGLGKYYSFALSMYGADIFVVSRTEAGWDEVKKAVEDHGQEVAFLKKDITEEGAAAEIIKSVVDRFGKLDILVNNAGTQLRNKVLEFKDEDWRKVINLNLNALYTFLMKRLSRWSSSTTAKLSTLAPCSLTVPGSTFSRILPASTPS